jgi:hypothetical protein
MADMIRDGKGTGYLVGVNAENRMMVESVTQTLEHHTNQNEQLAFNLVFQQTPTGANDCFCYIKNSNNIEIVLEGMWIRVASNEQILVYLEGQEDTIAGHSGATPTNLYSGSGNIASGTFRTGNDITGLINEVLVNRFYIAGGNESKSINFEQDIILPKNQIISFHAATGSIEIDGTIMFNYHEQL